MPLAHARTHPPAPPTVELLDGPPSTLRRPLALVDGRAYAAAWLYARFTRSESSDARGYVVKHDPPLVEYGLQRFVLRDDGLLFGPGGDRSLDDLGLDVALPEMPHPSRTWSAAGVKAYRAGQRPDPATVFNRVADVVSHFVDFDRSLAGQRTMAEMVACFVLATWFLDAFNVIGYLWPNGERGSGKTVLLHTVAEMAYLGHVILAGGSYASLRDLAEYGATLAFDDAEHLADPRRTEPDKRALLLAGNRRGSTVTVKELGPDKMRRTRHVNAFCPRLFSAIRLPDNVLASRSIVIPLIRTADRRVANVDPLDAEAWPHGRRQLIDDLWALALAHLPTLRKCERTAIHQARLAGRTLEPWRAILAVALWLDGHDPHGLLRRSERPSLGDSLAGADDDRESPETGLWERMETLSVAYQRERSGLETDDLTTLVIRAMCYCAVSAIRAISANNPETPSQFVFTTAQITAFVQTITQRNEGDPNYVTSRRIGRVLGQMRLEKAPRPGGKGGRRWRVTRADLARWTAAYGLSLPGPLALDGDAGPP